MADEPSTTTTDAPATDAKVDDKPADLGDAGKKALDAERAARREAERQLKELQDRDKSEIQKLQDGITERDSKLADLPKQARSEAIKFASAASRAGFVDPEDALAFIDVDLSDTTAVETALKELAERKPHLVRAAEKQKLPGRRKPAEGDKADPPVGDGLTGKARAAAALRQFKNT